jgi:plasmid stabilization system protein ParE
LSYSLALRPEAADELRSAYLWYETKRAGLGDEFLLCVEAALARVRENPFVGRKVHRHVRRVLTRRFPYGIFNVAEQRRVVVIAVFHGRRDPGSWMGRSS